MGRAGQFIPRTAESYALRLLRKPRQPESRQVCSPWGSYAAPPSPTSFRTVCKNSAPPQVSKSPVSRQHVPCFGHHRRGTRTCCLQEGSVAKPPISCEKNSTAQKFS